MIVAWTEISSHLTLGNAHKNMCGAEEPMAPFLRKSCYKRERFE